MTYRLESYADIGAMLRDVRESYSLTVRDIAYALQLNTEYVDALEDGRLKDLPGMAYARGYIRNYALLLRLDAESLLSQFEAAGPQKSAVRFMPKVEEDDFSPRNWQVGAAFVALLFVVFLASEDWWGYEKGIAAVRPIPVDIVLQYEGRQKHIVKLQECLSLLLVKQSTLCYYQRGIRRAVLKPRKRFSTALTVQTISESI